MQYIDAMSDSNFTIRPIHKILQTHNWILEDGNTDSKNPVLSVATIRRNPSRSFKKHMNNTVLTFLHQWVPAAYIRYPYFHYVSFKTITSRYYWNFFIVQSKRISLDSKYIFISPSRTLFINNYLAALAVWFEGSRH